MKKYCIVYLTPGGDEYFYCGGIGGRSARLSREKCTVFNNLCDAVFTVGEISLKKPQFCEMSRVMELCSVADEEVIKILRDGVE